MNASDISSPLPSEKYSESIGISLGGSIEIYKRKRNERFEDVVWERSYQGVDERIDTDSFGLIIDWRGYVEIDNRLKPMWERSQVLQINGDGEVKGLLHDSVNRISETQAMPSMI